MNKKKKPKELILYELCNDIHDYLESQDRDVLDIPSCSWWQSQKQYGIVKRISRHFSFYTLRTWYLTVFIRIKYVITLKINHELIADINEKQKQVPKA